MQRTASHTTTVQPSSHNQCVYYYSGNRFVSVSLLAWLHELTEYFADIAASKAEYHPSMDACHLTTANTVSILQTPKCCDC